MTSDRFGSISGLLANKPAPRQATVHPITAEPGEQAASTPAPRQRQRAATAPSRPRSEESSGATRRVAFRLEPDLHARLAAAAKNRESTHGNIVLDAIEDAHSAGRLGDLVAADKNTPNSASTALFVRSAPRGPAKPSIPVEIQLHTQAVDQLDRLVSEHSADSRTQLMVVALRAHLEPES